MNQATLEALAAGQWATPIRKAPPSKAALRAAANRRRRIQGRFADEPDAPKRPRIRVTGGQLTKGEHQVLTRELDRFARFFGHTSGRVREVHVDFNLDSKGMAWARRESNGLELGLSVNPALLRRLAMPVVDGKAAFSVSALKHEGGSAEQLGTTLRHELGHLLHFHATAGYLAQAGKAPASGVGELVSVYRAAEEGVGHHLIGLDQSYRRARKTSTAVSRYALQDRREFFAENFAAASASARMLRADDSVVLLQPHRQIVDWLREMQTGAAMWERYEGTRVRKASASTLAYSGWVPLHDGEPDTPFEALAKAKPSKAALRAAANRRRRIQGRFADEPEWVQQRRRDMRAQEALAARRQRRRGGDEGDDELLARMVASVSDSKPTARTRHDEAFPVDERVPDAMVSLAKAAYRLRHGNLESDITEIRYDEIENGSGLATVVNGVITHQGRKVGSFTRILDPDNLRARHEELAIDLEFEGQGFAEAFNRQAERHYRRAGIEEIELSAVMSVGGYAWAKQGYQWEPKKAIQWSKELLSLHADLSSGATPVEIGQRIAQAKKSTSDLDIDLNKSLRHWLRDSPEEAAPLITPEVLAQVQALGKKGRRVTPLDVAGLGRGLASVYHDDRELWLGKVLLLGNSWDGVKRLDSKLRKALERLAKAARGYDPRRATGPDYNLHWRDVEDTSSDPWPGDVRKARFQESKIRRSHDGKFADKPKWVQATEAALAGIGRKEIREFRRRETRDIPSEMAGYSAQLSRVLRIPRVQVEQSIDQEHVDAIVNGVQRAQELLGPAARVEGLIIGSLPQSALGRVSVTFMENGPWTRLAIDVEKMIDTHEKDWEVEAQAIKLGMMPGAVGSGDLHEFISMVTTHEMAHVASARVAFAQLDVGRGPYTTEETDRAAETLSGIFMDKPLGKDGSFDLLRSYAAAKREAGFVNPLDLEQTPTLGPSSYGLSSEQEWWAENVTALAYGRPHHPNASKWVDTLRATWERDGNRIRKGLVNSFTVDLEVYDPPRRRHRQETLVKAAPEFWAWVLDHGWQRQLGDEWAEHSDPIVRKAVQLMATTWRQIARAAVRAGVAAVEKPLETFFAGYQALVRSAIDTRTEAATRALRDRVGAFEGVPPVGFTADLHLSNERAAALALRHSSDLVNRMGPELRDTIQRLTAVAAERGQNPRELADALERHIALNPRLQVAVERFELQERKRGASDFDARTRATEYAHSLSHQRALTVARTELLNVQNAALQEAWAEKVTHGQLPSDLEMAWVLTKDDLTCPSCRAMNGKRVRLGEQFLFEGRMIDRPPAHPRCRCTLGAVAPSMLLD